MPVTTLDPMTALVVIDLQKGLANLPTAPHSIADVVTRSKRLADAFRQRRLPIVWVNVTGGAPGRTEQQRNISDLPPDWAELIPELGAQPDDLRVTKRTWGAFPHTDLEAKLRDLKVSQIMLTGVATSIGVGSTAREAYALGFNVSLATDAMTDLDAGAHENSITRIFPRLGETGTTDEILRLVDGL